jgi:hypothetical protein
LTNTDDDTAGITVSAPSGTFTSESGGAVTFTVQLESEPLASVTIALSSSDSTEGSVSPSSIVFTAANWNTPQTITATGINDSIDDGDIAWTVLTAAAISSDAAYNGLNPADVALTNTDDDTAGITVSAPSGTFTSESGGAVTFTVQLDSQPLADVTVALSSSDSTEGSVSPSSIVFTAANWNTPQTVTATGLDDLITDGDIQWTVVLAAATSQDALYNGVDAADVLLVNSDNDLPGITVSAPSGSSTTEAGGTVTFTVKLNTEPAADVTIAVSSSDSTEGSVSTNVLFFTTANWDVPQIVTAVGVDDAIVDGNVSWTVVLAAASSTDPAYDGINPADVTLSNTDNDTAGITVSAPSGSVTTEAGGSVTFTIRLNSEPTANVTVAVSSSDATEGSISPTSLIFTAADWNTPQTVTVTGVDDTIFDGSIAYTAIIAAAASADALYDGLNPADISLTNTDDDLPTATKFYAVDDAAVNRTFEYAEDGTLIEFYSINSSNSAPRGIATVTAGDRLWVIDASRRVFVYDNSGGLLGSWTAGSLASNARVEGIATDGTHIWIVDARADRVFYYANAASRLSGTQTATTNFALARGNAGPKDLVFGTQNGVNYLWVVNDASTDRVFRYTLNASGVATASTSWLINSTNARPTGITLDPSNGSMDIWISDNSSDRIYRYSNGRTATAPALASSFALAVASGNGNVQGIADPPPVAIESTLAGYQPAAAAVTALSDGPVASLQPSLISNRSEHGNLDSSLISAVSSKTSGGRLHSLRRQTSMTIEDRSADSLQTTGITVKTRQSADVAAEIETLDDLFSDLGDVSLHWLN